VPLYAVQHGFQPPTGYPGGGTFSWIRHSGNCSNRLATAEARAVDDFAIES
jgi:hypothetical protein